MALAMVGAMGGGSGCDRNFPLRLPERTRQHRTRGPQ